MIEPREFSEPFKMKMKKNTFFFVRIFIGFS